MKPEQIKKVVENHNRIIDIPSRLSLTEMCWVVEDLLEEERKHIEETAPYATVTISELQKARDVVRDLYHTIDDMDTNELVKQQIWD